uniref:Uncharacterized protein n=1 Tax=Ananas comosus var. bracteatus TaxID=296719 RepID=A0A6V7QVN9_ANACO
MYYTRRRSKRTTKEDPPLTPSQPPPTVQEESQEVIEENIKEMNKRDLIEKDLSFPTTLTREAPPTLPQQALLSQALTNTATLAKLLPSAPSSPSNSSPRYSRKRCVRHRHPSMTQALLALLAFSCILACFTDRSFRSPDGRLFYGLPLHMVCGSSILPPSLQRPDPRHVQVQAPRDRLVSAALSAAVFVCVALRDKTWWAASTRSRRGRRRRCWTYSPGVGVICSLLFMVFPTRRHGVGHPVSPGSLSSQN